MPRICPPACYCVAVIPQGGIRFHVTSLAGCLLLPGTPLRLLPAVAVQVAAEDYDQVVLAAMAEEDEDEVSRLAASEGHQDIICPCSTQLSD